MNKDKLNIFILAAGQGERLRPITNHVPKPLISIAGKPAIEYVLENVSRLLYEKIGINAHYKKEALGEWLSGYELKNRIILFNEDDVLGTGGALKNAESFLNTGTFLVHNSDILSDIDLKKLLEHHRSSDNLVTLAVHYYPKFNRLLIDKDGFLENVGAGLKPSSEMAFTGIAIYEPEFLKFLPDGESSVVDAWLKALSTGHRIGTYDVSGCYWTDIGTPSAYASAVFHQLKADGETVYIHPSINRSENVGMQGHVVIEEGCEVQGDVTLNNCILLSGCNVEARRAGPLRKNCIIGPDYQIDLAEKDILDIDDNGRQLIGTGGSDRKYYRMTGSEGSSVLMQCKNDDPDFERQIEYTGFFMHHDIPVPKLIRVEEENKQAVFEDAGDISLYSYLKFPRRTEEIEAVYEKVVDVMAMFHAVATEHVTECPLLQKRIFDREYFRGETSYFIERFVEGNRQIELKQRTELDKELDALAMKADSFSKTVMHRDFQSQNIMVLNGQELRVIDYQGARIGPSAYDAGSMLWDPYHRIEDGMRERLLEHYTGLMKERAGESFTEESFRDSLYVCRLQRHMQALGAYGFLSSVGGKKYFLKYVPEALRLLREDIGLCSDEYPVLNELIMQL